VSPAVALVLIVLGGCGLQERVTIGQISEPSS